MEPDFDPSVRVSVGDLPEIGVVTPREEAGRHAGRDPEEPQHHRHRTGEVLAVSALRSDDEADEWWESRRGAGVLGVGETSGRPQPRLECDRRRIGRSRLPRHTTRPLVERCVRKETPRQQSGQASVAPRRGERRDGHAGCEVQFAAGSRQRPWIRRWHAGELLRRRPWRVAPDGVMLIPVKAANDAGDALALVRRRSSQVVRDREASPDHVIVPESHDGDLLAKEPRALRCRLQLATLPRRLGPHVLQPARAVEPVEHRRTPVVRPLRRTDREHRRPLLREAHAVVVGIPEIPDAHSFLWARIEVPVLPIEESAFRNGW